MTLTIEQSILSLLQVEHPDKELRAAISQLIRLSHNFGEYREGNGISYAELADLILLAGYCVDISTPDKQSIQMPWVRVMVAKTLEGKLPKEKPLPARPDFVLKAIEEREKSRIEIPGRTKVDLGYLGHGIKEGETRRLFSVRNGKMKFFRDGLKRLEVLLAAPGVEIPKPDAKTESGKKKTFVGTDPQVSILKELKGNALTLKSLVKVLNLAEPTIRSALYGGKGLVTLGLVENKRGRGYYSPKFPPDDLE